MSDIAAKSAQTFAARVAIQLFAVLGGIAVARVLGPSGKGFFTYATTVLAMVQTVYAGQSAAISWQYGKGRKSARAVFFAALRIFSFTVVPVTALVAAVAAFGNGQPVLYAVAAALPFALVVQLASGFFLADSDVGSVNLQQGIATVGAVLLYVPLLFFTRAGLSGVLAGWTFAWMAAALFSLWHLRRRLAGAPEGSQAGLLRGQIVYGSQIALNSVVSYLNFRIDVFLVLFLLGQGALGVYSIGIAIGELLFQISRPIVTAAFGRIARSDEKESARLTAACVRHSFALSFAASVVLFIIGPTLITLVYGMQFAGAGSVLRLLLPGIIAYSTMPVLATFFSQQLGNPRIPLALSSASTIICAGVTLATLKTLGISGAAIATSVSYATAFVLATLYFVRRTGVPLTSLFVLSPGDLHAYRSLFARMLAWGR